MSRQTNKREWGYERDDGSLRRHHCLGSKLLEKLNVAAGCIMIRYSSQIYAGLHTGHDKGHLMVYSRAQNKKLL